MKITILSCIFLTASLCLNSQNKTSNSFEYFGPYKVFVNGNSLLKSKKKKFNRDKSIKNEDLLLYHADADSEKKTFSSNAISVDIPSNATIEKAMVVWACNYNFCFVDDQKGKKPIQTSAIKTNDGSIKFKAPFHEKYKTLTPTVLVDNSTNGFIEEKNQYDPSVFSIDITDMLKGKSNVNGLYWFADYYTLQGQTLNGISSGWSIIIVYKLPDLENNFISGLIGYNDINTDSISTVTFPNIKNSFRNREDIPFSLTMFLLGGDPGEGEERFFWSKDSYKNIPINITNRNDSDVLNGTIDNFGNRLPKLRNNFGVDLLNVESNIPSLFFKKNHTSGMTLGITSENNNENIQLIYSILQIPYVDNEASAETKTDSIVENTNYNIANTNKQNVDLISNKEDDIIIKSYHIPNLEKGYYIINGVFSIENNRKNWIKNLKKISNYKINYFNNPLNSFDYIYIYYTKNLDEAKTKYLEARGLKDFEDTWILEVLN